MKVAKLAMMGILVAAVGAMGCRSNKLGNSASSPAPPMFGSAAPSQPASGTGIVPASYVEPSSAAPCKT